MNGPEHYRLAEKCMDSADGDDAMSFALIAEAQVHAMLALTAATVAAAYGDMPVDDSDEWMALTAVPPRAARAEPDYRALLVRAVRELADSGSPGQNALGAELARDGGIEP